MDYLQYVNLLIGTNSVKTYSNGNTSPIAALPNGTNSYTVETRPDSDFLFFNPNDHQTTGLRLTHQLSPWLGDYGAITFLPTAGDDVDFSPTRSSGFIKEKTVFEPTLLKLFLLRYRSEISLVPTKQGGAGQIVYENKFKSRRLFIDLGGRISKISIDPEKGRVTGFVTNRVIDSVTPKNFKEFFVAHFSCSIDLAKTVALVGGEKISGQGEYSGENLKISLCFKGEEKVNFALATSYISGEQAETNLKSEIGDKDLNLLYNEGKEIWQKRLSKIEIDTDDEEQKRTFYSCFWRTNLFPRAIHEYDQSGKQIHYSMANGKICDGPMYVDIGFWDIYRTTYPLLTITEPDLYADIILGLLNFWKESGWLPRFSCPGPLSCMPGTAIDMVFADAVTKDIITDENQIQTMLDGMLKHATVKCDEPRLGGRDGIEDYIKLGYVPLNYRESVNKTLDYAYGDFCIYLIAQKLGNSAVANEFKARALNYKNIFDPKTYLMKAKDEKGNTRPDFKEFEWSFDYTEGSAWQNSFSVFHDMAGHAALMGGREEMLKMTDRIFSNPPIFEVGYRGKEIHEMTEMASVDFGQCALSNQPSFHIPYIYAALGDRNKTCYQVRRALKTLFNSGENGYPGDEDTGSMSAWYILSTLGFYPFTPATGEYVLSCPAVEKAVIHLNNNDLVITAKGATENIYPSEISRNGLNITKTYITYQSIMAGGNLDFKTTSINDGKLLGLDSLPFSLSQSI